MKYSTLYIFFFTGLLLTSFAAFSQETVQKKDSFKRHQLQSLPFHPALAGLDTLIIPLPQQLPMDKFNPTALFNASGNRPSSLNTPQFQKPSFISPYGSTEQFLDYRSGMAGALLNLSPRLNLYSSATLGIVTSPVFGTAQFYRLNAGGIYALTPSLTLHGDVDYHSNFGNVPLWNTSLDLGYHPGDYFQLNGGLNYLTTGSNRYNIDQNVLMLHAHTRFMLYENVYMNLFGGLPLSQNRNAALYPLPMFPQTYFGATAEYWFVPTTAIEAGIIWNENPLTKRKSASPVIGIKIDPTRK
jgi:hypothetical protein